MNSTASNEKYDAVFVTGSLPPIKCGVGIYSDRLMSYLPNTKLFVVSTAGTTFGSGKSPNLSVKKWSIIEAFSVCAKIKSVSAPVVHIQYPAVGYKRNLGINLLPYLLRLFVPKKKIIITLHEYSASRLIGKTRNIITCAPAHKIVVSNLADQISLPRFISRKTSIIPIGSNIAVVPNSKEIWTNLLTETGLSPDPKTLLFFGFAQKSKNVPELIKTIELAKDFQLLLLTGLSKSDEYEKKILEQIDSSPAKGRIGIGGYKEDSVISVALQNAQYFLLPQSSPLTTKSGTALAAITHNLPVISTGLGAPKEVLHPYINDVNCALIATPDANNIYAKILELEANAQTLEKITQGTKNLAGEFSWNNIANAYEKLYEST